MFTDLAEKIRDKGKALKEGLFKDRQFQLPDALVNEVLKRNLDKISASAGVEFRGMVLVSGREFFTLEGSIAHRGIAATVSIRVLPSEITWHTNTHVIRFEILEKSCAIQKAGLRGMLAALVMTVVVSVNSAHLERRSLLRHSAAWLPARGPAAVPRSAGQDVP